MEEKKSTSLEQIPADPSVEDSSVSVPEEPNEESIEEGGFLDPVDANGIDWSF